MLEKNKIDSTSEETRFRFLNDLTDLLTQEISAEQLFPLLSELLANGFGAETVFIYQYNHVTSVLSLSGCSNFTSVNTKIISSFNIERGEGGALNSVIRTSEIGYLKNLDETPISLEFLEIIKNQKLISALLFPISIGDTPLAVVALCFNKALSPEIAEQKFLKYLTNHLGVLFSRNQLKERLEVMEKQVSVDRKIIVQKSQDLQKKGEKIGSIDSQLKTVVEVMLSSYADLPTLIQNIFLVVSDILNMDTIAMGRKNDEFIELDYVYDKERILKVGDQFPSLDIFKIEIKGANSSSNQLVELKNPFNIKKFHNHPVYSHLGFATFLSAPLVLNREPYGIIFAVSKDIVNFSPYTEDLLSFLAQKLSFELEKNIMEEKLQAYTLHLERSNNELKTITTVGQSITSILNFDILLHTILHELVNVTGCEDATLYLVDEETDELVIRLVAQEKHKSIEGFRMPTTKGIAGWTFTNKQSQIVNDTKQDNRHNVQVDKMLKHETQSILTTPIMDTTHNVLGVLQLINKIDKSGYTKRDLEFLELLAPYVYISLRNAKLFTIEQESTRKATEAQRLKSEFLSNMSHELRTPLTSIIAYTDILSRDYDSFNERQQKSVDRIKLSSQHLLNLINDILDLSKIEAGMMNIQKSEVDLDMLILSAISTFEIQTQQKGLQLQLMDTSEKVVFKTDEIRVKQILINLISNAIKFTESGGIYLSVETKSDKVYIAVRDTGIGIPEDSKELIFESFRQVDGSASRKAGGTGLGLAISQRLATLLDGTLELDSQVGSGSKFTLVLPYTKGVI